MHAVAAYSPRKLPSVFFFGILFSVMYTITLIVGSLIFRIQDLAFYTNAIAVIALIAGSITTLRKGTNVLSQRPEKKPETKTKVEVLPARDHTKLYSFLALFTITMTAVSSYFFFVQGKTNLDLYTDIGLLVALSVGGLLFSIDMITTKPASMDKIVSDTKADEIHVTERKSSLGPVMMISMTLFAGMAAIGHFAFNVNAFESYSIMLVISVILSAVAISMHAFMMQDSNEQILELQDKKVHIHTEHSSLPKVLSLFTFIAVPAVAISTLAFNIENLDFYTTVMTASAVIATVLVALMKKVKG